MMPIREKNHRLTRESYKGFVSAAFTLCIFNRKPVFTEPAIIRVFLDILIAIAKKTHCIVPAYCFMPDHLHLLIRSMSGEADLWKTVVTYKQKTGYWLSINKPEIKWQKDFYDHIIRSDEKTGTHIKYILDNPVRKGIAASWQDYPYKGSVGCSLEDVLNTII
jgi:putative transposase